MKPRATTANRVLALLAVLALALAACGGGDSGDGTAADGTSSETSGGGGGDSPLAERFPDGVVRIGIANEVPYGYEGEDGEPTGEAPELAKAILAELGIDEVEATVVEFGSLIPGLLADQYDMIAAGMFINPERAEQVLFSDPDYCADTSFAVAEGNPKGIETFESFLDSDAILGVLGGAVEETYAIETGIPDDQIAKLVREHFDLRPKGIVNMLDLLRPIYNKTAAYGHFGRSEPEFSWEATDKVQELKKSV